MKKILSLLLLVVMSFSIAHGVVLDIHQEDKHCSVQEFVSEFSHPIQHDIDEHNGDLCNSHFMLHLTFILPPHILLLEIKKDNFNLPFKEPSKSYSHVNNSFRPPIA
jgi:hypothetical protein